LFTLYPLFSNENSYCNGIMHS